MIAQSFVLLHSAQLEMVLIVRRTRESIVTIMISRKRLEPWASKKACRYRRQGSHIMRLYAKQEKRHALSNKYALISEMRLITTKCSISLDGDQGIVVTHSDQSDHY